MALHSPLRIKAQSAVLRMLAKRGIILMKKTRYDRIRHCDLVALMHSIGTIENFEVRPTPARLALLQQLVGTSPCEAVFLIINLHKSLCVAGDVCEFGVGTGATSTLLASEITDSDRALWLFDSFAGLPSPTEHDILINDIANLGSMAKYKDLMSHPEDEVLHRLKTFVPLFNRYHIVKGLFNNSAEMHGPDKICFAYIDFDFYKSIKDALMFTDARLSPGGAVIVDDYGFFSAGAQQAVDEFVQSRRDRYDVKVVDQNYGHFCILRRRIEVAVAGPP
jgi:O-methyltransferase